MLHADKYFKNNFMWTLMVIKFKEISRVESQLLALVSIDFLVDGVFNNNLKTHGYLIIKYHHLY
jgi:hypothetical protein